MNNLEVCIACLSSNNKMHCIRNTQLHEFFGKNTNNMLSKLDGIPETMCYLCYSQLQKCYRFMKMSQKAGEILTQLLSDKVQITQETVSVLGQRTSYGTIIQQSSIINPNESVIDDEAGCCTDEGVFIDSQVPETEIQITVKEETSDINDQMTFEDNFAVIKHEPMELLADPTQQSCAQENNELYLEPNGSKVIKDLTYCNKEIAGISQTEINIVSETSPKSQSYENDLTLEAYITKTKFPITQETKHIEVVYLRDHNPVDKESVKVEMDDLNDKAVTENNENNLKEQPPENLHIESNSVPLKSKSKKKHFSVKDPYVCSFCGKIFHSPYHLRRHLVTHTGEKQFACKICHKKFSQKVHLTQHMKLHTHTPQTPHPLTSGEKPYVCEICSDKAFSHRNNYKTHMKRHYSVRLHICNLCSSSFHYKGDLNRHMRTHTGEKPFTCNLCNSSFRQNCHLSEHMRIHVKVKKYVCDFCQETFVKKCELNNHISIHTVKCYACSYEGCEKSFRSRLSLGLHSRVHTGEPSYSCEICNKSFKQKATLTIHKKVHLEEIEQL